MKRRDSVSEAAEKEISSLLNRTVVQDVVEAGRKQSAVLEQSLTAVKDAVDQANSRLEDFETLLVSTGDQLEKGSEACERKATLHRQECLGALQVSLTGSFGESATDRERRTNSIIERIGGLSVDVETSAKSSTATLVAALGEAQGHINDRLDTASSETQAELRSLREAQSALRAELTEATRDQVEGAVASLKRANRTTLVAGSIAFVVILTVQLLTVFGVIGAG